MSVMGTLPVVLCGVADCPGRLVVGGGPGEPAGVDGGGGGVAADLRASWAVSDEMELVKLSLSCIMSIEFGSTVSRETWVWVFSLGRDQVTRGILGSWVLGMTIS